MQLEKIQKCTVLVLNNKISTTYNVQLQNSRITRNDEIFQLWKWMETYLPGNGHYNGDNNEKNKILTPVLLSQWPSTTTRSKANLLMQILEEKKE